MLFFVSFAHQPSQTCSRHVFSPWEGATITVPDPEFDFAALLKQRLEEEEQLAELDMYDPTDSLSPLSTPPSTPVTYPIDEINCEIDNIPALNNSVMHHSQSTSYIAQSTTQYRAKQKSKKNRKRKRELEKASRMAIDYVVPPRVRQKFTHAPEPITTDFNTNSAPHASTGYIGLREETWKCEHSLEELLGPKYGFTHCPWTGE